MVSDRSRAHLKQALEARAAGNMRRAHELLRGIVDRSPRWSEAHFQFGSLLRALGHHDLARNELTLAVLDPIWAPAAFLELAKISSTNNADRETALHCLRRCLLVLPTYLPAIGMLTERANGYPVSRFAVAIGGNHGAREYFDDLTRLGRQDWAETLLRECLALSPASTSALSWVSWVARSMEKPERETMTAIWAACTAPRNLDVQLRAVDALFRTDRMSEAMIYAGRATSLEPKSATAWFWTGRLLRFEGKFVESDAALAHAGRLGRTFVGRARIVAAGISPADFQSSGSG
jgi:tetratricopeptide (TPR) repeat protein